MAVIDSIKVNVGINITEETALKCLKILEMYLIQEEHLKVTCKRIDGVPKLELEERACRIQDDGYGGCFMKEYLE